MFENLALTEATYYILLSLYKPQHGYGIMQQAEALSHGRVRLAAGTLYGALNAMVEKRWIVQLPVADGSRKKNYQITELGLTVLKQELERLRELVNNGDAILGAPADQEDRALSAPADQENKALSAPADTTGGRIDG